MGISFDVGDKRRAEAKVKETLQQKSYILSALVNQFRSSSQSIYFSLDSLAALGVSEKQKVYLDTIRQVKNTEELSLSHASDFTRLETGQLEMVLYNFDFFPMLNRLVLDRRELVAKGVELFVSVELQNMSCFVNGCQEYLRNVLALTLDYCIEMTRSGSIVVSKACR